jgi:hypothetical protein
MKVLDQAVQIVSAATPSIQVNAENLAAPTKHAFTKCGVINERLLPIVIDSEFLPAEAELLMNPNWYTNGAAANSDSTTITTSSNRIVGHPKRAHQQMTYSTYARKRRCQLFLPVFPQRILVGICLLLSSCIVAMGNIEFMTDVVKRDTAEHGKLQLVNNVSFALFHICHMMCIVRLLIDSSNTLSSAKMMLILLTRTKTLTLLWQMKT